MGLFRKMMWAGMGIGAYKAWRTRRARNRTGL